MEISQQIIQFAVLAFFALSAAGLVFGLLYPYFTGSAQVAKRVVRVADTRGEFKKQGLRSRLMQDAKDNRRKQIQDTLKEFEEREKRRKKRLTLKASLMQSGLDISVRSYWIGCFCLGVIFAVGAIAAGAPLVVAAGASLVGGLGLPRWAIGYLRKRRQEVFLHDFADAIDVMVRGLKAGLPVTDAMKVIAAESPPPVGPEFMEVVEGQRIGITMDQGVERMFERMPLSEVNFLSIVMSIQAKTGGNLAEALSNLSKVLRDRKKMKQKITAVSQEAKASAAIIGALPFVICAAMTVLNPTYLTPLIETDIGHILIAGSFIWMGTGVLIMRKMINFEI